VIRDPQLAASYVRLHQALEAPSSRLDRDERLAEWLHAIVERASAHRRQPSPLF
jgi:hypothetical protein